MAKGSRSNSKKAVRAQRRSQPQTAWQEAADARRFAALAAATVSEPVGAVRDDGTIAEPPEPAPARPAKAAAESSAMQTDQPKKRAGKRKGIKVGRVQKKAHNSKKKSALWTSEFHKKKVGKKGLLT